MRLLGHLEVVASGACAYHFPALHLGAGAGSSSSKGGRGLLGRKRAKISLGVNCEDFLISYYRDFPMSRFWAAYAARSETVVERECMPLSGLDG